MGIELICDSCKAPMCAFSHRADGARVCMYCRNAEKIGTPDPRTLRAIGALTANHRGYVPSRYGIYMNRGKYSKLAAKGKALIKHDRILRGEE